MWRELAKPAPASSTALGFRYRYVGRFDVQWDRTTAVPAELLYVHARHYSPEFGRFLEPDPSDGEKNSYGYAGGSPATLVDPEGECASLGGISRKMLGRCIGLGGASGRFDRSDEAARLRDEREYAEGDRNARTLAKVDWFRLTLVALRSAEVAVVAPGHPWEAVAEADSLILVHLAWPPEPGSATT